MPISTPASLIEVAKYCAAALVVLASTTSLADSQADRLQLGYLTNFANSSLEPSLDRLGFGSLQQGHSQDANTDPSWTSDGGKLVLQITRPADLVGGVASLGVFATPVNFGPGTIFEARATFIKPVGPHGSTDTWAIVVGARTGDNDDLFEETRVDVSLQVRGTLLRFNAPGTGSPGPDLPREVYDEIFSSTDPQPFTLELLVDRISGAGRVSLEVGDRVYSRPVNFPTFPADSGPSITAVGPSLGIASAPGQTASVHLREFRMHMPSTSHINSADTCADEWDGFNCRAAPE